MDAGPIRPPLTDGDIRSIFAGIMLAMFLSALDQTIVATAMPTIGRELGDAHHLAWIVTAYLLAATATTPLYGKFADMYGRRVVMLSAIGIFVAGSVACALAPTMITLALARALQGLGGGGLIALAQTIVGDIVAPRDRGRYQAWFGSVFASASVLGPVLGGFFASALHWSWIFWINLPLGALALWLVGDKLKKLPRHDRFHRLDVLGAALMVGATISLMLAVSWGGVDYPWDGPIILGLFAASALLWGSFGWRLVRAAEPLIPLVVLRNPVVAASSTASALTMGTYVGLVIVVPLFFEAVLGFSARQSGLAMVVFMIGVPLGATAAGRAMASVRHYRRIPVIGTAVAAAALAAFALVAVGGPFWATQLALGFAAIGLGTVFPVATVAAQNAVEPHHLGTATAALNFLRQLAAAIIVAIFGAIVLVGRGVSLEGLRSGRAVATDPTAFTTVFWAAAVGFAAAFVTLLVMEERPLRERAAPVDLPGD